MNNNINTNNQPETIDQDGISGGKKILFVIFLLLLLAPASIFIIFNFVSPDTPTQAMYYDSVNGQYVPLADNRITINGNIQMVGESEEFQFLTKPKDETKDPRSIYKPKFSLLVADEGSYEKIYLQDWVRFDSDRLKLVWTADFVNKGTCEFVLSISKGGYDFDKITITLNIGYQKLTILGPSVIEGAQPIGNPGDIFVESTSYSLINEQGEEISSNNGWKLTGDANAQLLINAGSIIFDPNKKVIKYTSINQGQYKLELSYQNISSQQEAHLSIDLKISEFMQIKWTSNPPTNPNGEIGLVVEDNGSTILPGQSPTPYVADRQDVIITSPVTWEIEAIGGYDISKLNIDSLTGVISWDNQFTTFNTFCHVEFNLIAKSAGYYPAVYFLMIDYKKEASISNTYNSSTTGSDTITAYTQWNSESSLELVQYHYLDGNNNPIDNAKWTIETYKTNASFAISNDMDMSNNISITNNGKITWNSKLTSGYYNLKIIASKNSYWSGIKIVNLTVNDSITFDINGLTPGDIYVKPNSSSTGKPLPSNNLQYDPATKTIELDYFHGHGGTIIIPFTTTLSTPPPSTTFELTSPTTNTNYTTLSDNHLTVETFDDHVEVTLGDEIVDNDNTEYGRLYNEILLKPSSLYSYSYDKTFEIKLLINYYANWFENYASQPTNPPLPTDANYRLIPLEITIQEDSFFISNTSSAHPQYKKRDGSTFSLANATINIHISNFYDRLDRYNGILPDNFMAYLCWLNGYEASNVYVRFTNNFHTVKDNFMAGFCQIKRNTKVDIIFPDSLLYAGNNFLFIAFINSNFGSEITFNQDFTLPQNLRTVGNDAFNQTFSRLWTPETPNTNPSTSQNRPNIRQLPPLFNFPQKLYKVGKNFAYQSFEGTFIEQLAPSFNFPQNVVEYGENAYCETFAGSALMELPLSLTIPPFNFISSTQYNPCSYFMNKTFYGITSLTTLSANFEIPQIYFDVFDSGDAALISTISYLFNNLFNGTALEFDDSPSPPPEYRELKFPNYTSNLNNFTRFFSGSPVGQTPPANSSVWVKRNS